MTDKWAEHKQKFCGCKDASRLNRCQGRNNCELPEGHPERVSAAPRQPPVQDSCVRCGKETVCGKTHCEACCYEPISAPQPSDDVAKDAARYRWLRKVTPYRFKKIQDASVTDGGDVLYFHADKFDAAIDAAMAGGE